MPTQQLPPLPPEPPASPEGFFRRHRTPLVAVGVVLAAIGVGAGVAVAASGGSGGLAVGTGIVASTPSAAAPAPTDGSSARNGAHVIRGTITAVTPTGWTVHTKAGQTVTVVVGPKTHFGTKAAPQSRAQLTIGSPVAVAGVSSGDTITATRVALVTSSPTSPHPSAPSSSAGAPSSSAGVPS